MAIQKPGSVPAVRPTWEASLPIGLVPAIYLYSHRCNYVSVWVSKRQINYLKAENPSSASTDFIIKPRVPNGRAEGEAGGAPGGKRGQTLSSCTTNSANIIPFNTVTIYFLNRNGNRLEERKRLIFPLGNPSAQAAPREWGQSTTRWGCPISECHGSRRSLTVTLRYQTLSSIEKDKQSPLAFSQSVCKSSKRQINRLILCKAQIKIRQYKRKQVGNCIRSMYAFPNWAEIEVSVDIQSRLLTSGQVPTPRSLHLPSSFMPPSHLPALSSALQPSCILSITAQHPEATFCPFSINVSFQATATTSTHISCLN